MSAPLQRPVVPQDDRTESTGIAGLQTPALIAGIIGLALTALGYFVGGGPAEAFRSYLPSYIFWFDIVAGSLAVLMLQYVTGGEWGLMIRRPAGAAARTMLVMAALFIPIIIGMRYIFPWADPAVMAHDPVLQAKSWWLSPKFFILRAAIYFGFWLFWAWKLKAISRKFEENRSPYLELSRRRWASSGLLMIVLTLTFASVDWVMSLEPKWYSTMFGISFVVGAGLSALAFVTFFFSQLARRRVMATILKPTHLRDLGNLMLAFTMLWAYTAFSEFLLIWYGNIKEETPYFLKREHGTWGWIAASLVLFHFFLPFTLLLMRAIKDRPKTIAVVTIIILVMRYVDLYWLIGPAFYGHKFHFSWMNLTSLIGIGGVWLYFFIGQLKGQSIVPIHETWVEEAIREGAVKVHD
jgi:hypothetical protein